MDFFSRDKALTRGSCRNFKARYLIRHGESQDAEGGIRQRDSSRLSEKGRKQAELLAERCETFDVDALLCSDMPRAIETAQIFGVLWDLDLEQIGLFRERRRPSAQDGLHRTDPLSLEIDRLVWENFTIPRWRHSDEENFEDLKDRAERALRYLEARPEQALVVVMHGFFAAIMAASAIFGEELNARICKPFMRSFRLDNTGISRLEFNGAEHDPRWVIDRWNDHAHLG